MPERTDAERLVQGRHVLTGITGLGPGDVVDVEDWDLGEFLAEPIDQLRATEAGHPGIGYNQIKLGLGPSSDIQGSLPIVLRSHLVAVVRQSTRD